MAGEFNHAAGYTQESSSTITNGSSYTSGAISNNRKLGTEVAVSIAYGATATEGAKVYILPDVDGTNYAGISDNVRQVEMEYQTSTTLVTHLWVPGHIHDFKVYIGNDTGATVTYTLNYRQSIRTSGSGSGNYSFGTRTQFATNESVLNGTNLTVSSTTDQDNLVGTEVTFSITYGATATGPVGIRIRPFTSTSAAGDGGYGLTPFIPYLANNTVHSRVWVPGHFGDFNVAFSNQSGVTVTANAWRRPVTFD